MPAETMTNARRRAAVLSRFEEQLLDMWPDEADGQGPAFAGLDDLEAAAAAAGDAAAREPTQMEVARAALPEDEIPERCDECGSRPKAVEIKRRTDAIGGPSSSPASGAAAAGAGEGFPPPRASSRRARE
jgi:hypothetical protein